MGGDLLKCSECAGVKKIKISIAYIGKDNFICEECNNSYVEKESTNILHWISIFIFTEIFAIIINELIFINVKNIFIKILIKFISIFLAIVIAHFLHCFYVSYEKIWSNYDCQNIITLKRFSTDLEVK